MRGKITKTEKILAFCTAAFLICLCGVCFLTMLRPFITLWAGESYLLDDVTVPQLTDALGVPVLPVEIDGGLFLDTILQSGKEE